MIKGELWCDTILFCYNTFFGFYSITATMCNLEENHDTMWGRILSVITSFFFTILDRIIYCYLNDALKAGDHELLILASYKLNDFFWVRQGQSFFQTRWSAHAIKHSGKSCIRASPLYFIYQTRLPPAHVLISPRNSWDRLEHGYCRGRHDGPLYYQVTVRGTKKKKKSKHLTRV